MISAMNVVTCFSTEYPLNPKSRSPRMLVIKKGSTKDLQISGFPVGGNVHSQPAKNGTGTSVYKGLVPKPVIPPAKVRFYSGVSEAVVHYHFLVFSFMLHVALCAKTNCSISTCKLFIILPSYLYLLPHRSLYCFSKPLRTGASLCHPYGALESLQVLV